MQRHAKPSNVPMREIAHWACQLGLPASECQESFSGKDLEGIRMASPMVFSSQPLFPASKRDHPVKVPDEQLLAPNGTKRAWGGSPSVA
jgi:hypothetical protein